MSTEGDSAKSALSDANDKSGTDNHTDTSQDSADVPVIKEKTEKQPETPAENDVETKNAVEKDDEKLEIEEKESAPESEELDNQKEEGDSIKPNKEKPVNDNESDDLKKEESKEDDKKESDEDEKTEEKKPEVKEAPEKEKTKKKEAVISDREEEEGEDDEEEEPEDEEEEDEEELEGEEEVVEKKKAPGKGGRKEKKKAVPLLDQPLETTGKRERKNVQRFTEPVDAKEPQAKVEVESGSGTPLGEIPRIDASISRFKNDDLKLLYKLLFKQVGKSTVIKKQIRKFNGFAFAKDSEEYKKKVASASKLEIKHLKSICEMLDLTKTGTKDDIIGRILEFLLEPKDSGKPLAGGRPKRASAVRANNRGYSSHDDFSSDEKHSSRARRDKGKRTNLKDDTSSDEEFRPDNASDGSDDKPKTLNKRKRGRQKTKKAASSEEEEEGSLSELSSDESDEEPHSKRRRSVKVNNKTKAKATPRGRRGRPKATAATTPRRGGRPKRSRDTSEDESDQKDEGSSSEDEPLAKKKTKNSEPPTDDEIKTFIKSILEGANLEEITMKTVCQRVYANYPEFDLSHKKDFIKTTVKSLIST